MRLFSFRSSVDPFQQVIQQNKKVLETASQGKKDHLFLIFDEKTGKLKKAPRSKENDPEAALLEWKGKSIHLIAKEGGRFSPEGDMSIYISLIAAGVLQEEIPKEIDASNFLAYVGALFRTVTESLERVEPLDQNEVRRLYNLLWRGPVATISALQTDPSHPALLIKRLADVFDAVKVSPSKAIRTTGNYLLGQTFGGMNGSYYIRDIKKEDQFVFKPIQEEKDVSRTFRYPKMKGGKREQVAYLLAKSQGGVSIPPTFYVVLNDKVGSLQSFVANATPLSILNTKRQGHLLSQKDFQRLALFHGRINYTDGHLGNVLAIPQSNGSYLPIGIDNGYSLGEHPMVHYIQAHYLHFPALHQPLDKEIAQEILSISIKDAEELMLKHGLSAKAIRLMQTSTRFQQLAAAKGGFTPFEILRMHYDLHQLIAEGDEICLGKVLDALAEMKEVKDEGVIERERVRDALVKEYDDYLWQQAIEKMYESIIVR